MARGRSSTDMAYLRVIERPSGAKYFYIMKSVRKRDKVYPKACEYLGRDPEPARLRAALKYWKVGVKPKGKRKGGK